ncbi:hypothetical protein RRG08_025625 [Elysia crispata]|uniref:Uncharacterized protein n=1 Tax=Elysia crispata TaxID=231223 RepID=A0AAE0YEZ4_9GAST|nr:hypothetical protein RRG08_025625 [Elysia crispata]
MGRELFRFQSGDMRGGEKHTLQKPFVKDSFYLRSRHPLRQWKDSPLSRRPAYLLSRRVYFESQRAVSVTRLIHSLFHKRKLSKEMRTPEILEDISSILQFLSKRRQTNRKLTRWSVSDRCFGVADIFIIVLIITQKRS